MRIVELTESLSSPYPFKWNNMPRYDDQAMVGKFKGAKENYVFKFDPAWEEGKYEIDFQTTPMRSGGFQLTGTGDAFRVLATVMAMIEDGVKRLRENGRTVNLIWFTAQKEEGSSDPFDRHAHPTGRADLYKRMIQKYGSRIGTVEVDESEAIVEFRIKVHQP